jgi:hypothetical protein
MLGFLQLLLEQYPPALAPVDYASRLLRHCLTQYASVLDSRPGVITATAESGGGKRGKKRARGAEDGLIGGLEGRETKALSEHTVEIVMSCLKRTYLSVCTFLTFSRIAPSPHAVAFAVLVDFLHALALVAAPASGGLPQDGV